MTNNSYANRFFTLLKDPRGIFALLLLLSTIIYWHGRFAVATADHFRFQRERAFSSSEWEFFRKAVSFDRTRQVNPDNYFAFRPGMMSVLAILDIFIHDKFLWIGFLSILWHAFVAFTVFIFLKRVCRHETALIAAVLFVVQFAGSEIVLWRHISPYLFSPAFFLLGAMFADEAIEKRDFRKALFSAACTFVSVLFHESALATSVGLGVFFLFLNRKDSIRLKLVLLCFFAPPALCQLWNYLDFLYYAPPSFLGMTSFNKAWQLYFIVPIYMIGLYTVAFFFPHVVEVGPSTHMEDSRWQWDFSNLNTTFYFAAAAILIAGYFASRYLLKNRPNRPVARYSLYVAVYFLVLVFGVGYGRVLPWSTKYLMHSTYYFYFSNLALLLLAAIAADILWEDFPKAHAWETWVISGFAAVVAYNFAANSSLLWQRTLKTGPREAFLSGVVDRTASLIKRNPNFCFVGTLAVDRWDADIPSYLYRESCSGKSGEPVFLARAGEHLVFVQRPWAQRMAVPDVIVDKPLGGGKIAVETSSSTKFDFSAPVETDPSVHLGKEFYKATAAGFESFKLTGGGMILGYKDPKNYIALGVFKKHGMGAFKIQDGKMHPLIVPHLLGNADDYQMGLEVIGTSVFLVKENTVFQRMDILSPEDLHGRVGVYLTGNRKPNTMFKRVYVATDTPAMRQVKEELPPMMAAQGEQLDRPTLVNPLRSALSGPAQPSDLF